LIEIANKVATPGKGILAADESTGSIGNRFQAINVENTEENRRKYRQLLIESKGLGQYISGIILFDETFYQKNSDGVPFVDILQKEGVCIGIKLDKGQQAIEGAAEGETSTDGLDGLSKRCADYRKAGARFAKWRAVIVINTAKGAPTELAIAEQTRGLARYASICQANGLVPVVEPEVLMDGDHSIEVAAEVTQRVWAAQFKALADHHILLEGCLLKPNFVRSGEKATTQASTEDIAKWTLRVLQNTVPPAIPGINFLSGGMSEEEATLALHLLNTVPGKKPWVLSFSYGRALQKTVLKVWAGKDENVAAAQEALMLRAKANGEAQLGKYGGGAGGAASKESSFVANYKY